MVGNMATSVRHGRVLSPGLHNIFNEEPVPRPILPIVNPELFTIARFFD